MDHTATTYFCRHQTSASQYVGSCMRKTMSFDNSVTEFSQQSVVFAMERFVRAVSNMDDTVMVPCKLLDVPVGSDPDLDTTLPARSRGVIRSMQAADLHNLFTMLNSVKSELIWGTKAGEAVDNAPATSAYYFTNNNSGIGLKTASTPQQHSYSSSTLTNIGMTSSTNARRPSLNSMNSVTSSNTTSGASSAASSSTSTTYSDSESESGIEQDPCLSEDSSAEIGDREADGEESVQRVANQFRRHLLGLHQCLEQLADAANYLTHRYQVEIGSSD